MALTVSYISYTKQGTRRELNKDRIYINDTEKYSLFIVFDGVSTSPNAISAIELVEKFIVLNENKYLLNNPPDLLNLMTGANEALLSSNILDGTATFALIYINKINDPGRIEFSNLGDTRIYHIKNHSLKQITADHNLFNASNIVTKYLGMQRYNTSDFAASKLLIRENERLLICTDGFYELLEKNLSNIHQILNFKKLENLKKSLNTNISSNHDDATYVLIDISHV